MLKWVVVVVLVVVLSGLIQPGLAGRLRLGHLPGDVSFRLRGRHFHFPFTTTILFSLLAWVLLRVW
ncbi:DUF2905 family protein [Azoarcus sp. TTM-91]|uniref:DUF2905 domain-containing protein n=1 Tax=Azoarcus sp. TTM-91 TaxID=2691581 RepID=UPI00145CE987|nr:DUF2905 domain-containing protein [Azoarcus sp. TTM-91]NMG34666.1 DUF2905 family protein [Azoarcus sp. TTM-91]